jgi:hypothetical protein
LSPGFFADLDSVSHHASLIDSSRRSRAFLLVTVKLLSPKR